MFKGTIVALVTPFTEQNEVDFEKLYELIEWHIDSTTDAIVLCGTTGEAPTLSEQERLKIFEEAVRVSKGRIPLIAGTGSYDTQHSIEMTTAALKAGVDGALAIVPYYNRPTPEGCFQHFKALSKVGLPTIIYHHPGRTGVKLPVKTLVQIAELPSIVGIKDSAADLDHSIELIHSTSIPVFTGDDSLVLSMMAIGAVGVISVVANLIPREWKLLTTLLSLNQFEEARKLFYRLYPLVKAMALETNPQCVKYALGVLDRCRSNLRLPLIEPQDCAKEQIVTALEAMINGCL